MKSAIFALTALVLGLAVSGEVSAQSQAANYPTRAVTIVVPYPPGGGTDTVARTLARALSGVWGQQVIVENRAGADGLIGTEIVLRAPADGYTILMQINQMLMWKSTIPSARVDILKDFQLISQIQRVPMAVAVLAANPAQNFNDFIAWCLAPAQRCSWGSATAHSQLLGKQLLNRPGLSNAIYVPYKGTAPMMTDLLGSHISMGIISATAGLTQLKSGKLKFLAVSSRERFPPVPEVPTLAELGYKASMESWHGLMVAKATPQPIFAAIVAAVKSASKDPALLAAINNSGGRPFFSDPEEFARDVQSEIEYLDPLLAKFPLVDR